MLSTNHRSRKREEQKFQQIMEASKKNAREQKDHTTKEANRVIISNQSGHDKTLGAMNEHNDERKAESKQQQNQLDNIQEGLNTIMQSLKKPPRPDSVQFTTEATTIPTSSSSCGVESSSSSTCDSSTMGLSESTSGSNETIQKLETDKKRLEQEKLEAELEQGKLKQELNLYTVPKKDCYATPVRGRKRPSEREAASAAKHLKKQATGRAKRLEERNNKKFRYP